MKQNLTEGTSVKGYARIVSYTVPKHWRLLVRAFSYFNLNLHAQEIAERFGKMKWDTGFQANLGTNVRLAVFSGLVGNTGSQTAFGYMAVGTSNTAVSAGHTALQAEITDSGLARAASTNSRSTTTQANDTLNMLKTWTVSGTKTVEEIGFFNDPTAGIMGGRCLTGTKAFVSGDTYAATYKVIFS